MSTRPFRRSPFLRGRRGAARVSIVWLVALIAVFLVALATAFLAYGEKDRALAETADARAAKAEAEAKEKEAYEQLSRVSKAAGWFDPQAALARTDDKLVGQALADLKATFTDMGSDVKTVADALAHVQRAYAERGREITVLKEQVAQFDTEKRSLQEAHTDIARQKDTQITGLEREKTDERTTAEAKQTELDGRVNALTSQRNQLTAEGQKLQAELEDQTRKFEEERQALQARLKSMGEALRFLDEPQSPDATVLAVSSGLPMGWIDIGANNRLAVGTRFHLVSGRSGAKATKAWAEVTRVEAARAEVRFFDLADRFDPVVPGDVVYNPLYDPTGERHAVLIGRFSGRFSESELKVLLERLNIHIQSKLDVNTDYLIVGSELYVDPDGNALETPLQPSDLPIYKDAEAAGVVLVPIKDLYSYFKF